MTKEEVKELLGIVKIAYPVLQNKSNEEKKKMLDLWCDNLKEIDCDVAKNNLKQHIKISPYVPTIADVLKIKNNNKFGDYEQREYTEDFIESLYDNL